MPADIDVLVAGTSPISFSPSYLSFGRTPDLSLNLSDASQVLNGSSRSPFSCPRSAPLDFPTALGSSPLLSHSPPTFGPSSPSHYTFHGRCNSPTVAQFTSLRLIPKQSTSSSLSSAIDTKTMPVAVPRRPCLVVRCEEPYTDMLDPPSPNKNKKKVVFADDRGFPLTKVRTMTEPSNMPPRWSFQFLAQVTQGACAEVVPEPWEVVFPQPASDYLDFRRRLDTALVSLENVIVRESEQAVVGTVKVRNIAYDKEVFVRVTSDGWRTHEDAFCTYVKNTPAAHGVTVLYDTFSFRITLPPRSRRLEFCVAYRVDGKEYWDNNAGKNYVIMKKENVPQQQQLQQSQLPQQRSHFYDPTVNLARKFNDVKPDAYIDSWSEFASWHHLNNDTPYW